MGLSGPAGRLVRLRERNRFGRFNAGPVLSATMIADPIDAINEDEVGAPPCGAEGAWGVVSGPGRAKFGGKASPSDANPPNLAPNERSWGTRDQPNCSTFSCSVGTFLRLLDYPGSPEGLQDRARRPTRVRIRVVSSWTWVQVARVPASPPSMDGRLV